MSPIQYQKNIRLHEARLRLIAGPGEIAAAVYAAGYESPCQFSCEYRRVGADVCQPVDVIGIIMM